MKSVDVGWIKVKGRIQIDKTDLLLAIYCAKEAGMNFDEIIESINKIGITEKEVLKVL